MFGAFSTEGIAHLLLFSATVFDWHSFPFIERQTVTLQEREKSESREKNSILNS